MALIRRFEPGRSERISLHNEVKATYECSTLHGQRLVTIKTYGNPDRQMPTIPSQTIQLDRQGAEALVNILTKTFAFN